LIACDGVVMCVAGEGQRLLLRAMKGRLFGVHMMDSRRACFAIHDVLDKYNN
jgi:hypothetical protein